jgi:hypothetical protein
LSAIRSVGGRLSPIMAGAEAELRFTGSLIEYNN